MADRPVLFVIVRNVVVAALIAAALAVLWYRTHRFSGLEAMQCTYRATLALVDDDGRRHANLNKAAAALLAKHFVTPDVVAAAFDAGEETIAVEGGIPPLAARAVSKLAESLGATATPAPPAPSPEERLRAVFAGLRASPLGLYVVESDPAARAAALRELQPLLPEGAAPLGDDKEALVRVADPNTPAMRRIRALPAVAGAHRILSGEMFEDGRFVPALFLVDQKAFLTAAHLSDLNVTSPASDRSANGNEVAMHFDDVGAQTLQAVTQAHLRGYLAIAGGNEALMVPQIAAAISGGRATLTMGKTRDDPSGALAARRVVTSIRLGEALNVPLHFELDNVALDCD